MVLDFQSLEGKKIEIWDSVKSLVLVSFSFIPNKEMRLDIISATVVTILDF